MLSVMSTTPAMVVTSAGAVYHSASINAVKPNPSVAANFLGGANMGNAGKPTQFTIILETSTNGEGQ